MVFWVDFGIFLKLSFSSPLWNRNSENSKANVDLTKVENTVKTLAHQVANQIPYLTLKLLKKVVAKVHFDQNKVFGF